MNLENLLLEKCNLIYRKATKHGAYNVCIFGSFVCKKADRKGDIDFLVDMEPGRNLLTWAGF